MIDKKIIILTNGLIIYEIERYEITIGFSMKNYVFRLSHHPYNNPDEIVLDDIVYFGTFKELEEHFNNKCKELINRGFW